MNEVFIITWEKEALELRRIPSEGRWSDGEPVLASVDIQRPTRTTRFNHPESGGRLDEALSELFSEVEITLPVWFLLPSRWVMHFVIPEIDLGTPESVDAQMDWELSQRLIGDYKDFKRLIFPPPSNSKDADVLVVRTSAVQLIEAAADSVHLELAGIGVEPSTGEQYSFETPFDLRDAQPINPDLPIRVAAAQKSLPPLVPISAAAVVIGLAAAWFFTSGPPTSVSKPEVVKQSQRTIRPQASAIDTASAPAAAVRQDTASAPPILPQPARGGLSQIAELLRSLPAGSRVEMLSLSPEGCRAELSGIADAEGWVARLQGVPALKGTKLEGQFRLINSALTSVRLPAAKPSPARPGTPVSFAENAAKTGMTVSGRRATGTLEQATKLLDLIWQGGLEGKALLARDGDGWRVVVQ